jgi:hypothetical protein
MLSRKIIGSTVVVAVVGFIAGGFVTAQVMAAAAEPGKIPALTPYEKSITAYEKEGEAGGCGAPEKVIVDNEVVRVNLVSFPKGFDRCGQVKRRNHQLLVYLDPGDFTITRSGSTGQPTKADPARQRKPLPPGSAVFHARDSVVSDTHINNAYRILFVEMKK